MFQTPELKLDLEFDDLFFSSEDCTPLSHPVIVRKVRKVEGVQTKCPSCIPSDSSVIQGNKMCPYCQGIGYLWDEFITSAWIYKNTFLSSKNTSVGIPLAIGDNDFKMSFIATKRDLFLDTGDYVYTPSLDLKGRIEVPLKIQDFYKVIDSSKRATNQRESEFNIAKLMTTKEIWNATKE